MLITDPSIFAKLDPDGDDGDKNLFHELQSKSHQITRLNLWNEFPDATESDKMAANKIWEALVMKENCLKEVGRLMEGQTFSVEAQRVLLNVSYYHR